MATVIQERSKDWKIEKYTLVNRNKQQTTQMYSATKQEILVDQILAIAPVFCMFLLCSYADLMKFRSMHTAGTKSINIVQPC